MSLATKSAARNALDEFLPSAGREYAAKRNYDSWNGELLEHNYLHNHARMWYASIWIHTLKLPWQLGADWFLRHLLDGDPASNTLSWRWVAGLQTRGKSYLARADNIRKYTDNRFKVREDLASEPVDPDAPP
ncbi:MAG TPA: FAD-binding domain-containing protein, partial [Opitutales bacterium]|nr:FAD-binding domain-containing protein [Opitutales bacterium]